MVQLGSSFMMFELLINVECKFLMHKGLPQKRPSLKWDLGEDYNLNMLLTLMESKIK